MAQVITEGAAIPEAAFASTVDALASRSDASGLIALLHEQHPTYAQRGSAVVSRMRGWVLYALARVGVTDAALLFVLEELDTGLEPYPVAAAARALRSYPQRSEAFAPYLQRALANMIGHDEPISFARYGDYGLPGATSATREILATLAWLGGAAHAVLRDLEALREEPGAVPKELRAEFDRTVGAIRRSRAEGSSACCALPEGLGVSAWPLDRRADESIGPTRFEDQEGRQVTFGEFFSGQPSIVVFFYTRCDNPLKCSLTVTKLARAQALLALRGLNARIRTAAISYDPGFDSPERLRSFAARRGARLDANHRVLRALDGMDALQRHFALGVNFVESLVNRHRIEAYVLDRGGRIVCSFERLRWDEQEIVDRAAAALNGAGTSDETGVLHLSRATGFAGVLPSLALACLPKCPFCWATYLSAIGVAGLERVATLSWILPLLLAAVVINVAAAWLRARETSRFLAAWLATAGAAAIVGAQWGAPLGAAGVALTLAGSLLSAFDRRAPHSRAPQAL